MQSLQMSIREISRVGRCGELRLCVRCSISRKGIGKMSEIKISDVSFSYESGGKFILKDIHADVKSGEFVCILGQSGCGKSTLLRLLAGLEKPTTGTLAVDGEEIRGASLQRGVVFQDYGLFPWMTAGENIMLAILPYGGTDRVGREKSKYCESNPESTDPRTGIL